MNKTNFTKGNTMPSISKLLAAKKSEIQDMVDTAIKNKTRLHTKENEIILERLSMEIMRLEILLQRTLEK